MTQTKTALTKADYTHGELAVHREPQKLTRLTKALRGSGRTVALVPTMGALHDGHRELISRARRLPGAVVVVSIFVNPLQFGRGEDLDHYPRDLEADLDLCRSEGVDLVFAPEIDGLYPNQPTVTVQPGPLGDELEGAHRQGHFAGVLTVVAKLLNITRPDYAFFGEKDYQQLTLVKRMVRELNIDTIIVGVPTVRDTDGLALSSRNIYLSDKERESALALSAALVAGRHAGYRGAQAVLDAATAVLNAQRESGADLEVDYLELRAPDLGSAPLHGEARLLIAARVGKTRLIDNAPLRLGKGE